MQVNHVMLCDFVIPASGQQKQSIIGIFQAFNVPKLPFHVPRFFVVFEVEGESAESGKIDLAVLVQDADGGELFRRNIEGQNPGRKSSKSNQDCTICVSC